MVTAATASDSKSRGRRSIIHEGVCFVLKPASSCTHNRTVPPSGRGPVMDCAKPLRHSWRLKHGASSSPSVIGVRLLLPQAGVKLPLFPSVHSWYIWVGLVQDARYFKLASATERHSAAKVRSTIKSTVGMQRGGVAGVVSFAMCCRAKLLIWSWRT